MGVMSANRAFPTNTSKESTVSAADYAGGVAAEGDALWARVGDIIDSVSGTNTITGTVSPALTAYEKHKLFWFKPAANNTGATTINIDSLGAKTIKTIDGAALSADDLIQDRWTAIIYDGTDFFIVNPMLENSGGEMAIYSYTVSNGTGGGTATSGSYQTYPLNTEDLDEIGASISSNEIPLPAGTYKVRAVAPFFQTQAVRLRLYNVSDSAAISGIVPCTAHSGSSEVDHTMASLEGKFTISGTKTIRLEYRCERTETPDGLGQAASFGENEVYGYLVLEKV